MKIIVTISAIITQITVMFLCDYHQQSAFVPFLFFAIILSQVIAGPLHGAELLIRLAFCSCSRNGGVLLEQLKRFGWGLLPCVVWVDLELHECPTAYDLKIIDGWGGKGFGNLVLESVGLGFVVYTILLIIELMEIRLKRKIHWAIKFAIVIAVPSVTYFFAPRTRE